MRAFETVAMQAAGQDLQRGEEFAGAGGVGGCRIAWRGGFKRGKSAVALSHGFRLEQGRGIRHCGAGRRQRQEKNDGACHQPGKTRHRDHPFCRSAVDHTRIWFARL
ncbi:hypothetical protein [Mesorhizobium sp. M0340]|uniref:hypothetical protein n=1 Tax=Mesorhizobium sp. M0340 TaxID=2956939 RepID=UPI003338D6A7